jgi:hypothetical protein
MSAVTSCLLLYDDGTQVVLTREEATRLYEFLWRLAATHSGAVSAAGKIAHARQRMSNVGEQLDARESGIVRHALET